MNHTEKMMQRIGDCKLCELHENRSRIVYGSGADAPSVVIIGEAPGRSEDEGGEPFIGRSGKLLCDALEELGFSRHANLYITNTCRCRPPENRTPKISEIKACLPYLQYELQELSPKIILTLGLTPAKALLGKDFKMGERHGEFYTTSYGTVLPTYHPAAVLRSPSLKEPFLADLKKLQANLL